MVFSIETFIVILLCYFSYWITKRKYKEKIKTLYDGIEEDAEIQRLFLWFDSYIRQDLYENNITVEEADESTKLFYNNLNQISNGSIKEVYVEYAKGDDNFKFEDSNQIEKINHGREELIHRIYNKTIERIKTNRK